MRPRYSFTICTRVVLGRPSEFDVEERAAFPFSPVEAIVNTVRPGLLFLTSLEFDGLRVLRGASLDLYLASNVAPLEKIATISRPSGVRRVRMVGSYSGLTWDRGGDDREFAFVLALFGS